MADSAGTKVSDLQTLKSTVQTTKALIKQLQATAPAKESKQNDVNALDLAYDTASLIRAHSTKISLLVINKPFTPSAITGILHEVVSGALPGLASAIELCNEEKYTRAMSTELQYRAGKVISGLESLVDAIPLDGKALGSKKESGKVMNKEKLLPITGTIWKSCDYVIELKKIGIAGLLVKKADEYKDLLSDALKELQEWAKESEEDEDEEDQFYGSDNEEGDEMQKLADSMDREGRIPKDDPDSIRPRLESALKRLRLVILMYQAVVKRRFKTLPHLPHPGLPVELKAKSDQDPGIIKCLDEVLKVLKNIPELTDELASAFYDLDTEEIDKRMDECFFAGFAAAELLVKNWEGQKDEFSTWAMKFQLAMKKGW